MVPDSKNGGLDETRSFKVLAPGTVISHYKIIEKLGEGGMGVVYKATDTKLDRTVALKFLPHHLLYDSEARERFEHEAKAASALNHPNIATIHEIDEVEGRCFIAMEYLEGGSLKDRLGKKKLCVGEILDLSIQIGTGLSAAHERGVVHRDIKPDNIMLTRCGHPKIMDFGLAKLKGATKVTKTGTTPGTLRYMSPEQASGREVDCRSDIFSFGVILYEMVAGRLPFRGETEAAIINSILNDTPEPLARYKADVTEGAQRIVGRALEKDVSERYQHADDMVAELRHEKRLLETGESRTTQTLTGPRPARRKYLPIVIPVLIAAAVILFILIFEPFRIEVGPGEEASAQENSLAIMYFENMVDPEDTNRIAQMITSLLITDLSESDYMHVISRQRLYDILRLLGKQDLKVIDRSVTGDVAERAQARWILTGGVLQTAPRMVLTSEISEAASGKVVASQRVNGEEGDDLFTVVDRLSAKIRADLSLPASALDEPDPPVADVTTHSPEAYQHYLEGVDQLWKHYEPEAERSFRKALEYDSTFAMAYYWLAKIERVQMGPLQQELAAKAVQYSGHVGEKERHYINALAARLSQDYGDAIDELQALLKAYPDEKTAVYILGVIYFNDMRDFDKGIPYLTKAIEIDPLYANAYNTLAYAYLKSGDFEKALWAINKYISISPEEPNPYDSMGDIYADFGKIDEAIASYQEALEIKPDFYWSLTKLGDMYLAKKDYEEAALYYRRACASTDPDTRSQGRYSMGLLHLYQGKLEEALEVLGDGIGTDRMEQTEGIWCAEKYFLRASILEEMKDLDGAIGEAEAGLDLWSRALHYRVDYYKPYYVDLLARNGDMAAAEMVALDLKSHLEEMDQSQRFTYWLAVANVERAKGDLNAAVAHLQMAAKEASNHIFYVRFCLASAYLEVGKLGEAVDLLEEWVSRYPQTKISHTILAVKTHYLLGLAYDESGWHDKAIAQYEEFLDIWRDADPGIEEIEDARERLARLKGSSS
jgi:serine/threonine protein kinase/tetratricopeptide (TPR) repeat protein